MQIKPYPTATSKMLYPSAADTTMSPLPFLATTATTVNIGMDVPIAKSVSPVTYENFVPSSVFIVQ